MKAAYSRTKGSRIAVVSALLLVLFLAALDQTIVTTALPIIVKEIGGLAHFSWIVTAYLLATTVVVPLYGKLGDIYGRRSVLQGAVIIFLIGSLLCGMAQNLPELIAFRIVQGLGGGGLIVTATAMLGDIVPPRERGRYQGLFSGVFGLATIIGPLVGGFIVESVSWRWMFYINLPIGLLALAVINMGFKPGHRPRHVPIDYAGAALLAVALTCAILSISFSPTLVTGMPLGLAAIAIIGCLSLGGFLYVETAVAEPLLPLSLFRNRTFVLAVAICSIVSLALFGALTLMPMYFQVVKRLDPMSAGLHVAPVMLGMFLTSIISGQIISGIGRYKMFPVIGTALMALALALLSQTAVATPPWLASLQLLLLGAGAGMVTLNLVTVVHNAVAHEHLGVATSGTMLFRSIGGSIGAALLGGIFAHVLEANLAHDMTFLSSRNPAELAALQEPARAMYLAIFVGALHPGFIAAAALALVAFVLALAIKEVSLRASIAAEAVAECSTQPRQ